jgi:hypothetical protein
MLIAEPLAGDKPMLKELIEKMKINNWFLLGSVIGIIGGSALIALLFIKMDAGASEQITRTANASLPTKISLTIITDKDCANCFDITTLTEQIKKQNVKIISEKTYVKNDRKAKSLIKKFSIQKLPTFIISGDLDRNQTLKDFFSQAGDITKKSFVFRKVNPPYSLTETGEVKGKINFTLITDRSCTDCYDSSAHANILAGFGINTVPQTIDISSETGKELVNKYKISLIPTFILSGDLPEYQQLKSVWEQVGDVAEDGTYIFTKGVPLMGNYKDLSTNKIMPKQNN